MNKELIVFDLDGTLIDSSEDIAWATNRTLEAMGYGMESVEHIKDNIGWGVKMLLEKLMPGETPESIDAARLKFLGFYGEHLLKSTYLYPGVREVIAHFSEKKKRMAVVTNKPVALTEKILAGLDMKRYFTPVFGGDSFVNKKPHPEPLLKVLEALCLAPDKAVFVGDSPIDCETGKNAGVSTIGVYYGFRPKEEVDSAGFDLVIDSFQRLKEIIT